jgi:hypothetical protein
VSLGARNLRRFLGRYALSSLGCAQALVTQSGVSFYPDIYAHDSALKLAITERSQNLALHKHIATNF